MLAHDLKISTVINGVEVPLYIVADPAYPILPWVQKAFPHEGLTQHQKHFNTCLSKARFIVEHAFGRLKGRWRCLMIRNDTTLKYVITQISACCVLHNLCDLQQEEFLEEWWLLPEMNECNNQDDHNGDDSEDEDDHNGDDHNEDGYAINIRNALMNSLM